MRPQTVLFVDDDRQMLASLRRASMDEPFIARFANGVREAIEILREHEVHVLVTDLRMPDMSGLDLLKIVREEYPQIIPIVLSGQPRLTQQEISAVVHSLQRAEIFAFAAKVYGYEGSLQKTITSAVDAYRRTTKASAIEGTQSDE